MAKKVDGLPPRLGGHRTEEFPYDEWLDGNAWLLEQGTEEEVKQGKTDYSSSHATMRSSLSQAARRRGKKVNTRAAYPEDLSRAEKTPENQTGIYVQAYEMTEEELAKRDAQDAVQEVVSEAK